MNNNNFHQYKNFNYYYICRKDALSSAFEHLIENPDTYCRKNILKQDHTFTTTVAKVTVDGKHYVIKRYNIKGVSHALKRAIQPSRAEHCWYYGNLLMDLNIRTPKPIAMMERRMGPLRRQAYYICDYIDGQDGYEVFHKSPDSEAITQLKAGNTLELLSQFALNNLYHGDLKASNFIYVGSTPYIIDLDAMQRYKNKSFANKKANKDKKRFLQNWEGLAAQKYFRNINDEN